MAQFRKAVITQKGIALVQKTQVQGIKLTFTRLVTGSGEYTEDEALDGAVALKQQVQEFPFSSLDVVDYQTIKLVTVISNEDLNTAYYIREIGVYAQDPDEGEILYSLAAAYPGRADYMPAYDGLAPVTIGLDTYQSVSNSGNVTIRADTGAYAAAEDLEELAARLQEHINEGPISVIYENIPVSQRKAGHWYFLVTDKQQTISDTIKLSSNMGIRMEDNSDVSGLSARPMMSIKNP